MAHMVEDNPGTAMVGISREFRMVFRETVELHGMTNLALHIGQLVGGKIFTPVLGMAARAIKLRISQGLLTRDQARKRKYPGRIGCGRLRNGGNLVQIIRVYAVCIETMIAEMMAVHAMFIHGLVIFNRIPVALQSRMAPSATFYQSAMLKTQLASGDKRFTPVTGIA